MSLPLLQSSLRFRIRFSEIDAMRVVWHGAYAKYFEDAREQFGKDFGLDYLLIEKNGFYAPIVDLSFQYKQPLRYGMGPEIVITYRPVEAAKIIFDYEIHGAADEGVFVTGHSIQVFMDTQ
jgi:acyl-CoA thioester hydrolase